MTRSCELRATVHAAVDAISRNLTSIGRCFYSYEASMRSAVHSLAVRSGRSPPGHVGQRAVQAAQGLIEGGGLRAEAQANVSRQAEIFAGRHQQIGGDPA